VCVGVCGVVCVCGGGSVCVCAVFVMCVSVCVCGVWLGLCECVLCVCVCGCVCVFEWIGCVVRALCLNYINIFHYLQNRGEVDVTLY